MGGGGGRLNKINMIYTDMVFVCWSINLTDYIREDGVIWPCALYLLRLWREFRWNSTTSAIGWNPVSFDVHSNNQKWFTVYVLEHLHRWQVQNLHKITVRPFRQKHKNIDYKIKSF